MKTASVSQMKAPRRLEPKQYPAPDTELGRIFTYLNANRGQTVRFKVTGGAEGRRVTDLIDYYGLDIRRVKRGHWCLFGEWFGDDYVDYVAPREASCVA